MAPPSLPSLPWTVAFPPRAPSYSPWRTLEFHSSSRPSFRLVGVLLLVYLIAGTTAFYLAIDHISGHHSISHALDMLYFYVVTMTTVGYGALVPASDGTKLLASAFAFIGLAVLRTFLSKSANYLIEKQQWLLVRAVHAGDKHPVHALQDMEANRMRYKLYTIGMLLAVSGITFLWKAEGMRAVEAFYCACATVIMLGYGDIRSFTALLLFLAVLGQAEYTLPNAWMPVSVTSSRV